MDLDAIREKAREMMADRPSHRYREVGYVYNHGQRVGEIALQLREMIFPTEPEYDQVILVGAWLHDIGKGIEPHWEYGELLVRQILKDYCPPEQLEQIAQIVGGHTLRKQKPFPFYVKLVQDSDILDHFGTQEIWLSFNYAARSGGTIETTLEYYEKKYNALVAKVRALLNYEESVRYLDDKDRFVRDFVERLRLEAGGKLVQI